MAARNSHKLNTSLLLLLLSASVSADCNDTGCGAGKYADNGSECAVCPAGKFSSGTANIQCSTCPAGEVQPAAGHSHCLRCSIYQYIKVLNAENVPDNKTCVDQPKKGVSCNGEFRTYEGQVWHDPKILNPNTSTDLYTCINDGCPEKGARSMRCKPGYHGPLCAICDTGYFRKANQCAPCKSRIQDASLVISAMFVVIAVGVYCAYKYRRYLHRANLFPYLKVLISYFTVAATLDVQFDGIRWPGSLANAFDSFSVLSLDIGAFSHIFCMAPFSFYSHLLSTTSLLFVALLVTCLGSWLYFHQRRPRTLDLFAPVYLLIFAYPLMSAKLVRIFGCHNVLGFVGDGNSTALEPHTFTYLRVDYNLQCYDERWNAFAIFCGVCLAIYTVGLPLLIIFQLQHFRGSGHFLWMRLGGDRNQRTSSSRLAFLADDYDEDNCAWEAFEMLRKLALSVVGSFFSVKSSMAISVACLISTISLVLHLYCAPFKSEQLGFLQTLCLASLSLCYYLE